MKSQKGDKVCGMRIGYYAGNKLQSVIFIHSNTNHQKMYVIRFDSPPSLNQTIKFCKKLLRAYCNNTIDEYAPMVSEVFYTLPKGFQVINLNKEGKDND